MPEERRYRAKTGLALKMLRQALARGCLSAGWAAGATRLGMSPGFRDGLTAEGMQYGLDVPPDTPDWPGAYLEQTGTTDAGALPLKPRHQEGASRSGLRRRGARSRGGGSAGSAAVQR